MKNTRMEPAVNTCKPLRVTTAKAAFETQGEYESGVNENGLTPRQQRFADEYLIDFNATAAYKRAGYKGRGRSAESSASEILRKLEVKRYIERRSAELTQKIGLTQELVLKHWISIAVADVNDIVQFRRTCCRYCYGKGFRYQRTAGEMERDKERYEIGRAKALAKEPNIELEPFDEKGGIGFYAVKAPNQECPECFGEGVGDVYFKDTRNLSPEVLPIYAGIKASKDGIEIKLHSKLNALEKLARYLNMFDDKAVEVNINMTSKDELDAIYQNAIEESERKRAEVEKRRNGSRSRP